jgi:uncharacterized membrane protein YsdA (DUF1294 family)
MYLKPVLAVLLLINAAAAAIMYADKKFAIHHKHRVPERTLMLLALFGGSPGILFGMYAFRHKTKHPKFYLGVPAILIVEAVAVGWLWGR